MLKASRFSGRKRQTRKVFRDVLAEIAILDTKLHVIFKRAKLKIDTPVSTNATGHKLKTRVSLIPVLRSGLGMWLSQ